MVVLGIDPGYAIVGWGVVCYGRNIYKPMGYGAITTEADMPFNSRLEYIYNNTNSDKYQFRQAKQEKTRAGKQEKGKKARKEYS